MCLWLREPGVAAQGGKVQVAVQKSGKLQVAPQKGGWLVKGCPTPKVCRKRATEKLGVVRKGIGRQSLRCSRDCRWRRGMGRMTCLWLRGPGAQCGKLQEAAQKVGKWWLVWVC